MDARLSHGVTHPWEADRELTPDVVRAVARVLYPAVRHPDITALGSGWDFDAFRVGDRVVRFPRRAEVDASLETRPNLGVHLMNFLAPLGVMVPLLEIRDSGDAFPYRVTTHPWIEGVALDRIDLDRRTAEHLGQVLAALHGHEAPEVRDLPTEGDHRARWFDEAATMVAEIEPLLAPVQEPVREWLEREAALPPPFSGSARFLHNDMSPDHVLVDPVTRRVTGILDWDDAAWGDPAYDFHVFRTALPPWFVDTMIEAYPLEVDDGFRERIDFFAKGDAIDWLYESRLMGTDVEKHVRWVRNAFTD